MPGTDLGKTKARIRALARRTVANGCTPAEASTAAAMVADLMSRHGLSADDVAEASVPPVHGGPATGFDPAANHRDGFARAQPTQSEMAEPAAPPGMVVWKRAALFALLSGALAAATMLVILAGSELLPARDTAEAVPNAVDLLRSVPPGLGLDVAKDPQPPVRVDTRATDDDCSDGVLLITGSVRRDCVHLDKQAGDSRRR